MKYRKLRIAWSVVWGVVAVLLIVLWVRSYYVNHAIVVPFSNNRLAVQHAVGRFIFIRANKTYNLRQPAGNIQTFDRVLSERENIFGISVAHDPRDGFYNIQVRCFWFVASFATLAALPWIRWPTRFTLRTLLIATTLVAIVLGVIVWAAK